MKIANIKPCKNKILKTNQKENVSRGRNFKNI